MKITYFVTKKISGSYRVRGKRNFTGGPRLVFNSPGNPDFFSFPELEKATAKVEELNAEETAKELTALESARVRREAKELEARRAKEARKAKIEEEIRGLKIFADSLSVPSPAYTSGENYVRREIGSRFLSLTEDLEEATREIIRRPGYSLDSSGIFSLGASREIYDGLISNLKEREEALAKGIAPDPSFSVRGILDRTERALRNSLLDNRYSGTGEYDKARREEFSRYLRNTASYLTDALNYEEKEKARETAPASVPEPSFTV